MTRMSPSIQSVEFIPQQAPLTLLVRVRLSTTIPACCGVSDGAAMEFNDAGAYQRVELHLREDREGNCLEGTATFPREGLYGYRLTARILGAPVFQEGACPVGAARP